MVSVVASLINLATASNLMKVGKEHNSITLEADAQHLMSDVWTSAAVISSHPPNRRADGKTHQ